MSFEIVRLATKSFLWPFLIFAFFAAAQPAGSSSASLPCTGDQVEGNVLSLQFRTSLVVNWRLEKALLFVHVSQGRTPAKAAVSRAKAKQRGWQTAEIEVEAEGWIRVTLPPELGQALVEDEDDRLMLRLDGFQIHPRAGLLYVPYLFVEGKPKG
ncbi:MAG: hypothetical protein JJE04_11480 [Acidobacteriia bacterium]|nr:hypothetical protein [Terriglobia bacterium]